MQVVELPRIIGEKMHCDVPTLFLVLVMSRDANGNGEGKERAL